MITIETAKRVLEVVDQGLCSGLGKPIPGQMCIEAAVCYALGESHGDNPSCVAPAVRSFKINLNDARWSSNTARAAGMRRLAIAQLGSKGVINEKAFATKVAELTIRRLLPKILREIGLNAEADRCENEGTGAAAAAAAATATAPGPATATATATAAATSASTYAASATYAATYAAAYAAYAAYAAAYAAYATYADSILNLSAEVCLDALKFVDAPGIELLKHLGLE